MRENSSLFINNIDLPIHLGWTDNERAEQQVVQIDIEVFFTAPPKACVTDNLDDTYCYDQIIQILFDKTKDKQYHLVEHLAQQIHQIVKSYFNNEMVLIHVYKHPVIKGFSGKVRFSYGG